MAFLDIDSEYREPLERQGLRSAADFLDLPAVIVSGHPDRNVARVKVGDWAGFLKREHRVSWKHRLANFWAGFRLASNSTRESWTLRELKRAGVACPEFIAAGQDGQGRAFLLVRELGGVCDLRSLLSQLSSAYRRRFAKKLGLELARLHATGFDHPDLYAKHVLVEPRTQAIWFVDWQRSRRRERLEWRQRLKNLAVLNATLADHLASPRERLACLLAYLRALACAERRRGQTPTFSRSLTFPLAQAIDFLQRQTRKLRRNRRVREMLQPPLAIGSQNLIWLDGEACCVTREFCDSIDGRIPGWLAPPTRDDRQINRVRSEVVVHDGRRAVLVKRRTSRPWQWLWARLRGRSWTSPEFAQAATLFRLQRFGATTPKLLAVGQRFSLPWRVDSFLVLEDACRPEAPPTGRDWIAKAAKLLRCIHDANCSFRGRVPAQFLDHSNSSNSPAISLAGLASLQKHRRLRAKHIRADLASVRGLLRSFSCRRSELMRFILDYLETKDHKAGSRRLLRWFLFST